jgi:hypothetical protein
MAGADVRGVRASGCTARQLRKPKMLIFTLVR